MRVVFMGTPDFAVPSLRAVAAVHEVTAVYTRPDAPKGRGRALQPSPVKLEAAALGLRVLQPASLRDASAIEDLAALDPDVVCVAAYGLILPAEALAIPALGCVNVHASLLPRHRGAAPVERAILAGDPITGVSIMRMEVGLDTGPVAETRTLQVDRLSAAQLTSSLAELGAEALVAVLARIDRGEDVVWEPQDDSKASYAPKITRDDVALPPDLSLTEADRRVRASSERASVRIVVAGHGITVLEASPEEGGGVAPGAVSTRTGLVLGFSDGALRLERVRPDGRGAMPAADWLRGARLPDAAEWEPAA